MNSLIWKGVPSTTIKGLLISELPPITKPPMRVLETTVDGRDGSIIEELGYSTYDKNVVIGLHGSFDINKVIKYFTGEGEVVFSNEPEKVYTAKIVGQIDYNRLLKYRQAVIPFRVQPFKHKYNEAFKEPQTATATGTNIVLKDGGNSTIKNIVVGDGSKTEGQVKIQTTGKNLLPFPYYDTSKTTNGVQFTVNADGSICVKGTVTATYAYIILSRDLEFVDGMTYAFSGGTENTTMLLSYDEADGTRRYVSSRFVWKKEYTLIQIYAQVGNGKTVDETIYPMLELGTTESAFVPYQKSEATYDYATNTMSNTLETFEPTTTITNSDGASMTVEYFKPFEVFNEGLENSKPKMVLKGSGTVGISVNGILILEYTFPDGETEVVIDSQTEDAYLGDVLKNRNMVGEFPVFTPGINIVGWSGNVSSIEILPRSRWL